MLDLQKDNYIIVEIIPTRSKSEDGFIAQISALKLQGIHLIDRFDYRVKDQYIDNEDIKEMISYDKKQFTYVDNTNSIQEKFKEWVEEYPLLIIEDTYTTDYLQFLINPKELIGPYFNIASSEELFDRIMKKYSLQPSNHLVDLLYEAIIYEGNTWK